MTIHNLEGVKELENLGFKRAVLSRELSLEEIQHICSHTNIEIENFVHGALCICYSGQCLFSSMVGGRSGNRGKCAQPCRLPYELIYKNFPLGTFPFGTSVPFGKFPFGPNFPKGTDVPKGNVPNGNGYLLSTRDLCALEFLPQLIDAGVMCFKIEGRMKSPEYVATVTRIYRKYIDLALSDKPYVVDKKDIEELAQVFNRGNFSSGHLSSESNKDLVFPEKPNNMGIYIGNVSNIKPNKGHVLINLTHSISLGDSISFEKENTKYTISELILKGKNIVNANKGQFVEIGRMKGNIHCGDKIYRIASKELSDTAKLSYKNEHKKTSLSGHITLKENEPIVFKVETLNKDISITVSNDDNLPLKAKSKPITKERIIEQLSKTTDTIFEFDEIIIDMDSNLFLPSIKVLNELRRNALNEVFLTMQSRILRKSPNIDEIKFSNDSTKKRQKNKNNISVLLNILDDKEDYSKLEGISRIYIPLKYFADKNYKNAIDTITNNFETFIYLPTIIKSNYKNLLKNIIDNSIDKFPIEGFVLSNLSSFVFAQTLKEKYNNRFTFIGNFTLNVYNKLTINELKNLGLEKLTISPELDSLAIKSILNNSDIKQELIVYGRIPLMNMNYCLLGKTNRCYPSCGVHCKDNKAYFLKDRMGLYFRIVPDNIQTVSTIYNSKILSINGNEFDVSSYRVDILDENVSQINSIVETIIAGKRFEGKEYTNGNLNREI